MGRKDFFQFKNFHIHQGHAAMKLGTDSDLLGTLAEGGNNILDIGTGTGVLSLMLAQRYPDSHITAIEIDENAIIDAKRNFEESPYADRIYLEHISFQDFAARMSHENMQKASDYHINDSAFHTIKSQVESSLFDSIVCNPPYFDRSLECGDNTGRTRARHSSSLPFNELVCGAYSLLKEEGIFSVCIPPEVLSKFNAECLLAGFCIKTVYAVKSLPGKAPKRYIIRYKKGSFVPKEEYTYCMRNSDHTISEWYKDLMDDFHCHPDK